MQKLWNLLEPFVYNRIYQTLLVIASAVSFLRAFWGSDMSPMISILFGIGFLGLALFVERGMRNRSAAQSQSTE